MARVVESRKAATVNPLKMSAPLGACYAFLGMDGCMPTMHGSQGCTAFAMVVFVRHFREAIPLQTTAMNEVSTILGGMDNLEQAILNIKKRANPALVAIASTGLTETKGDDVPGFLKLIEAKHAEALAGTRLVYVSTPDYVGGMEDGWSKAVAAILEAFAKPTPARVANRINILPGSHLTPGDLEELRSIVALFGLEPVFLPDLAGSLDGHIPGKFVPTTLGGTTVADVEGMGAAIATIAIGEHMRAPAALLKDACGVAYTVFDRLTGLAASDDLVRLLATLSGREVPAILRRQRSQLQDAMLDAHFFFGGRQVAIAAEPDLLFTMASVVTDLGGAVPVAVAPQASPILAHVPTDEVVIGDLEDFERAAKGCDLLMTHSHGRQASVRLGIPLARIGMPVFDRIGNAHRVSVGYRGTRDTLFLLANQFAALDHEHAPGDWPLPAASFEAARRSSAPEPESPAEWRAL